MLGADDARHHLAGGLDIVLGKQRLQATLATVDNNAAAVLERTAQARLALGSNQELVPFGLGLLRVRGQHLHLVATGQTVRHGHQLVVDLAGNAVCAQLGVQHEGHVQHRGVLGQRDGLALGREHDNLAGKEVELDGVQEVQRIGLGVLEDVLDGLQPCGQLALFLALANLVLPVGRKSALGDVIHVPAAYLHLHPIAVRAHHGDVQRTITIGLGRADPVTHAVGVQAVEVGDLTVDVPADALLVGLVVTLKHDARGI